jgi:hypothetical protein
VGQEGCRFGRRKEEKRERGGHTLINLLIAGRQKRENTHIKNNKVLIRAPAPALVSGCWKNIPPTRRPMPRKMRMAQTGKEGEGKEKEEGRRKEERGVRVGGMAQTGKEGEGKEERGEGGGWRGGGVEEEEVGRDGEEWGGSRKGVRGKGGRQRRKRTDSSGRTYVHYSGISYRGLPCPF